MSDLNVVAITGNLGADVEVRQYNGGQFATFSVASNKKRNNRDFTTWTNWSINADHGALPYLKKGARVACEGEVSTKQYKTQSGENRTATNFFCRSVTLLSPKQDDNQPAAPTTEETVDASDLPFDPNQIPL